MVASDTTAVAFYEIRFCKIQVSSIPATDVPVTGAQSGETEYEFIVDYDQEVTLTAPLQVEQETIRYNFVRWMLNWEDQPDGEATLVFTATEDADMNEDGVVDLRDLVHIRNRLGVTETE